MSVVYCQSFLLESITGVHDFSADVIKIALFNASAAFSSATTAYTTANEIADGAGYTIGGLSLSLVATYPKIENNQAAVRYASASWVFTDNKPIRWALIHNSSKANRAILSIDLGVERSYRQNFTINFPLAADPVVRFSAPIAA